MASNTYHVSLWNKNHSHPEYPEGIFGGTLTLNENGLLFQPERSSLPPLVVHWDNLTSTYPDAQLHPSPLLHLVWFFSGYPGLVTVFTFGIIYLYLGSLSIKFKDARYDKICVVEFTKFSIMWAFGKNWANNLEQEMWELKRSLRTERRN